MVVVGLAHAGSAAVRAAAEAGAKVIGIEEKKEKTIYYATDLKQQSQYVNMFKQAKMDAVVLPDQIDQPFINQLEMKNEGIKFQRIDADLTDTFKAVKAMK